MIRDIINHLSHVWVCVCVVLGRGNLGWLTSDGLTSDDGRFGFSMSRGTCSYTKIESERYKAEAGSKQLACWSVKTPLTKKNLGRVKPWWGPDMTESKNDVIR